MNIYRAINTFCQKHTLLPPNSTVIIGLSGGADSVFLFHFLRSIAKEKNIRLIAAHLDHQWRENSGEDRIFCQKLAATYQIPFVATTADQIVLEKKYNGSHEEVARNKRRHFFAQVKAAHSADFVALAHHADDQQETFFMRMMRGTTLDGIVGMRPQSDFYIRPLLKTSKKEMLAYLAEHNFTFVHDHTNESDNFLRNRIRNHALPALNHCDARFDANVERLLTSLSDANDFIAALTQQRLLAITEASPTGNAINITLFFEQESFLQKRILLLWICQYNVSFVPSERFLHEIVRFLKHSKANKHTLHQTWCIKKTNTHASIHFL